MKILFCVPPVDPARLTGDFGRVWEIGGEMPPQGLCHLAAVTRNDGHVTLLRDWQISRTTMPAAADEVVALAPDVVGISASTVAVTGAAAFAALVKALRPQTKIVLGGAHASALPQATLSEFAAFDAVVYGEGEVTISEYLAALANRSDLAPVRGLAWRDGDRIRVNPPRPLLADLDRLPLPAWDLLPHLARHYRTSAQRCRDYPVASVVTSRGCPYACAFCDKSVFGTAYRAHGPEYVLAMLRELKTRYGIRALVFNDDLFLADRQRLHLLCEALLRENLRFSWSCGGRGDLLAREDLLLMRRAGCWQIALGIETGDPELLATLDKRADLGQIAAGVRLAAGAGLAVKGFFLLGVPGETLATIQRTIAFARKLPLTDAQFALFTPYPGSALYAQVVAAGFTPEWERMNTVAPSYVPAGLTADDLRAAQRCASRAFYFRPGPVFHHLGKLLQPRYLGGAFTELRTGLTYLLR